MNTKTESMRVSTDMGYVDVVASKWKVPPWWSVVALTLPQVRYCAHETTGGDTR